MLDFQKGDKAAFEDLVRRYQHKVYNFIYRLIGNAQTAEELFQDSFIKIFRAGATYRPEAKFTTWMYTVVRNQCIDHMRRKSLRQALSLDSKVGEDDRSLADTIASHEVGPDEKSWGLQVEQVLTEALAKLNEDQREVFLLREKEGLKFEEIAEVTGVSVNTVKSRMRYAIESLQRILRASKYKDFFDHQEGS